MALGSSQQLEEGDMDFVAAELTAGIAVLSYPPLLVSFHIGFASPKASRTEDVLIGA